VIDYIDQNAVRINHADFKDAVDELEKLVNGGVSEDELQKHLETHPYILSQQFSHCHHVFPKVALGNQYETDFFCLDIPSSGKEWIGVELELQTKKVVTKNGRKTAELEHAIQQIRDWRAWVTDNLSYARQSRSQNGLGLTDITPRFYGHVIIGRKKDYTCKFDEIRRQLSRDELIAVHSWDSTIEWARKRAQILCAPFEMYVVIKKQQEMITLKDDLHKLQSLSTELRHVEEMKVMNEEALKSLNDQMAETLQEIGSVLPDSLVTEIRALLSTQTPVVRIIDLVKNSIPKDISENMLEQYILKVPPASSQRNTGYWLAGSRFLQVLNGLSLAC
jgi:hypothetical protein